MIKTIIADTGIIVASLNKREKYNAWTLNQMRSIAAPLRTCEAVLTEACYLMRNNYRGKESVLELVERGILQIDFSLHTETTAVKELMTKYTDVPMDFADACIVRMSELIAGSTVFTLDSDFWVYRKNGIEQIPLIIPADLQI